MVELQDFIHNQKDVTPGNGAAIPRQLHPFAVFPTHKKLINGGVGRYGAIGPQCVDNRERYKNGTRPRRHLIDVEVEPFRHENEFWRDDRNTVPVVLPENGEIELGEGVAVGHSTQRQNGTAGANHERLAFAETGQFTGEVGLYRCADLGWPPRIDSPITFWMLLAANVVGEFTKLLRVVLAQEL